KKGLLGMFVGQVMQASKGAADPKKVNELLIKSLQ
ncbi:MAG: aspartyl-tRNA(Asn)/glutamyl-tRNA(Gln) amidotransferase subunit B, partial [Spirosomataceae bacterium]